MAHASQELLSRQKGSEHASDQPPASLAQQSLFLLAARFAASAAHSDDLPALQHEVCRVAAEGLDVAYSKLLVHLPSERVFLLVAGAGWREGIVGHARFDTDVGTAAGFAWQSGQSIISNDLVAEGRFRIPALLVEHRIARTINVVVPSHGGPAFGVLEVESPEPGEFTENDVCFLQVLAHSLAAAMGREAQRELYEEQAAQMDDDHRMSLSELEHRVRNDLQGLHNSVMLEARSAAGPLRAGFERVNRRIMGLAGLYDHLLSRKWGDSIDVDIYLRSLCDMIAEAADLPSRSIELSAETQPLAMPLDRVLQLSIAVNELVANAAEHAFPDNKPGKIMVRLLARGEDGLSEPVVTVSDDGRGFSGPRPGSAGLTFVERLAQRAGGVLDRMDGKDGRGTCWRIKFPVAQPKDADARPEPPKAHARSRSTGMALQHNADGRVVPGDRGRSYTS